MSYYNLTSQKVKDLAEHLEKEFDFKFIDQNEYKKISKIKRFLKMFGAREGLVDKWGVTYRDWVLLPFKPGDPKCEFNFVEQVLMMCHETDHVPQWRNHRFYMFQYLFSRARRTWFECRALRAEMEIYYFLKGRILFPGVLAGKLRWYALRSKDIKNAIAYLEAVKGVVEKGAITSDAAKTIALFLNKNSL
jgi:hypothetical protein